MKRIFITLAATVLSIGAASAQTFNGSYFLDNYVFAYRNNPAMQADGTTKSFFALGLGNINTTAQTNYGLSDFLYPVDGQLYTGLNKNISADQFLGSLPDDGLKTNFGLDMNIFSMGSAFGKGFFTLEANLRSSEYLTLPKEIFSFLKNSSANTLPSMGLSARNMGEVAVGYSLRITDNLTIGARVKGLVGLAAADINLDNCSIDTESLVANANGSVSISQKVADIYTNEDGSIGYDFAGVNTAGFGLGFDLGVTYDFQDIVPGLTASFSVVDLGKMNWDETQSGTASLEFSQDGGLNKSFSLENSDNKISESLPTTYRLGARYKMPFYDKLSAGVIGTVKTGTFGYSEARAGISFSPAHALSLTVNGGATSYGGCFGAALSLNFPIVNFFIGTDALVMEVTPQYVPVNNLRTTVTAGLAISIVR